jgi:competence protein ComEA
VLACVAIAAGVAWVRAGIAPSAPASGSPASSAHASTSSEPAREPSTSGPANVTSTTTGAIVVDVVGAVRAPGVVSLPASARVIDAIRAAGGAVAGADLTRLNLAAKLADGARVAVPRAGQPPPAIDPGAVSGGGDPSDGSTASGPAAASGPVDVNTATLEQLETLPGIGPTLAAAIVQERERNGPFQRVDDLTRVHGIGPGRLSQLRDSVTV